MSWISAGRDRDTFVRLLSPSPNEKILDVGAGRGDVAALVQKAGSSEVYALDPDRGRIGFLQKEHPSLRACLAGSESIPYPDGFFDKAYSTLAVHHFADQRKSFRELARILKPDGVLVIVDIASNSLPGRIFRFLANGIFRARLRFLTLEELVGLLGQEGRFTVRETKVNGSRYFVQAVRGMAEGSAD